MPNTFDRVIVFPGFGETWDNNPQTVPRTTADEAMEMTKALVSRFDGRDPRCSLSNVDVPRPMCSYQSWSDTAQEMNGTGNGRPPQSLYVLFSFLRLRVLQCMTNTDIRIQSSLDGPIIRVFFQGESTAAQRHFHGVRDAPLSSIANAHVLPRVPLRDETYFSYVQAQGQLRPPTRQSQPLLPQCPAIHAIWVAPMTQDSCQILRTRGQVLARQIPSQWVRR